MDDTNYTRDALMKQWSLTTVRDKLINLRAKVVHDAGSVAF